MKIQPLRIQAGWKVQWNSFAEVDPSPETIYEFQGSSLLCLHHETANRLIDLSWRPELDINGHFVLLVLNALEVFNPKSNTLELDVDWENPQLEYTSTSRVEIVAQLEKLMLSLPPYTDPRILKNRGVLDQPSENLRLAILNRGLLPGIVESIIAEGNKKVQDILLDHPEVSPSILEALIEGGISKGVRKKARQKLQSKRFRDTW